MITNNNDNINKNDNKSLVYTINENKESQMKTKDKKWMNDDILPVYRRLCPQFLYSVWLHLDYLVFINIVLLNIVDQYHNNIIVIIKYCYDIIVPATWLLQYCSTINILLILLSYCCACTLTAALFPPLLPTEDNAHLDIFISKQDINLLTRDRGWLFPSPLVVNKCRNEKGQWAYQRLF